MTNAAIVECGDVATVHAEALEALASDLGIKFVAVVDKDLETAEKFAAGLGAAGDSSESSVKAYGSLPALFAKEKSMFYTSPLPTTSTLVWLSKRYTTV